MMFSTPMMSHLLRRTCYTVRPVITRNKSSSSDKTLRFDGKSAVVTGAGRGLGRQHALLLASRGAKVVVNDFGGSKSGADSDMTSVAQTVVDEIKAAGGEAIVNEDSVCDEKGASNLIQNCLDQFGRIDIVINNAGILRDVSFAKMTVTDWDNVIATHLRGSFLVSHSAWPHMRRQNYGKIIMTSSTSGLYGNFGQANYSAAKMGLIGLSNTLAIEGARNNISCNVVVPMASTRMTEGLLPGELSEKLDPAHVAPLVAWLCHADCQATGAVFEAAGGWFGRYRLFRSRGHYMKPTPGSGVSIEDIVANWNAIGWQDGQKKEEATCMESFGDHLAELLRMFEGAGSKR